LEGDCKGRREQKMNERKEVIDGKGEQNRR
jgi:hypothetical protein